MINVTKASGAVEPFDESKVRRALGRAGVGEEVSNAVLSQLEKHLYEGIATHEIYSFVFEYLKSAQRHLAARYSLKQSIMDLGPSGYPFEKFVAGLLAESGYQTQTNVTIQGRCVSHEIDVLAELEGITSLIECKFHGKPGLRSDVKVSLYIYARFLDVKAATDKYSDIWLVTNTKLTDDALAFSACSGVRVLSWDYPQGKSLRAMFKESGLTPITCLTSLSSSQKQELLEQGIVFCKDFVEKAEGKRYQEALGEAKDLIIL